MEIQQLRHLLAAVQHGNLLKAAEGAHISQSGLSRSIKSLETRLGVPLLLRNPKGVEPTLYGESVLRRARVILSEVKRAYEEVKALQQAQIGEVIFGVTRNYAHYFIPDVLADLHRKKPDARIRVITGGFVELVEALKVGEIDFAFGLLGMVEDSQDVTVEALRSHRSVVVARPGHPLAAQATVSARALSEARWAAVSSEGFQRAFGDYFYARGLKAPAQAVLTDSLEMIRRLAAETDLLTLVPEEVVRSEIEAGLLTPIDCETPAEHTQVGLMFRRDSLVTPLMKEVIQRIRQGMEPLAEAPPAA